MTFGCLKLAVASNCAAMLVKAVDFCNIGRHAEADCAAGHLSRHRPLLV
jgi:hypothetical protein